MEDLYVYDIRNTDRKELDEKEVPNSVEEYIASYNNISSIYFEYFFLKVHIATIDLSYNQLTDLTFLRCFNSLRYLNVSHNFLDLDSLLDIRNIVIARLYIKYNNFDELHKKFPQVIPTILSHAWVINGIFITDYQRKMNKNYETTLEFGNVILANTRYRSVKSKFTSTAQAGKHYIFDHDITYNNGVKFTPPLATYPLKIDQNPQIERVMYLREFSQFQLPDGEFDDYFGLALGILSHLWIGESLYLIPRLLCRVFWFNIYEDIQNMENWELHVVLFLLMSKIKAFKESDRQIWATVNVERYLKTGTIPMVGSIPRLVIAAFIARAIATSEGETSNMATDDLRAYFKYRRSCGFTQLDTSVEAVYKETVAPFYQPTGLKPQVKEKIDIVHPLTGEWVHSVISHSKNGRITMLLPDVISIIPISAVFWDGRGTWREAAKKDNLATNIVKAKEASTFITAADLPDYNPPKETFHPSDTSFDLNLSSILGNSFRSTHLQHLLQQQPPQSARPSMGNSRSLLNSSKELKTSRKPVEIEESKMMPGWRTFRGIVDPPFPRSQRSKRVHGGLLYGNAITDVVNVVNSNEYSNGKPIKRYNVRLFNSITKKSKYTWISEDEIKKEDLKRLNDMYKSHVTTKLKVGSDSDNLLAKTSSKNISNTLASINANIPIDKSESFHNITNENTHATIDEEKLEPNNNSQTPYEQFENNDSPSQNTQQEGPQETQQENRSTEQSSPVPEVQDISPEQQDSFEPQTEFLNEQQNESLNEEQNESLQEDHLNQEGEQQEAHKEEQ